jgi:transposase
VSRRQKSRFAQPPWNPESEEWQGLDERLAADHRARWVETYVDGLDLSALEEAYRGVGSAAHRADLLVKIILLEVFEGRRSPAQWARDVRENIPLLWIGRGIRPSRTAFYNFRDRLGNVIQELVAGMVQQAIAAGLVEPKEGVQDGTTTRASASRHRTINLSGLVRRRQELAAAIFQDKTEQAPPTPPRWMAKTSEGRQEQSERFAKAQEILESRLAENARRPKDKRLDEKKVTVSTSDPEAAMGRDKEKTFCPLYTSQFVVEPNSLVILAFEVFAQATDTGTLAPLLDRTALVIGLHLDAITADSAYATLQDLQECAQRGVELFAPVQENDFTARKRAERTTERRVEREQFTWLPKEQTYACPQGHRLDYKGKSSKNRQGGRKVIEHRFHCPPEHCRGCPLRQQCVRDPEKGRTVKRLEGQELLDGHRVKMKTAEAQAKRKRRGEVIERSFADAKEHRNLRKLHGRGLGRARAEVGLVVMAQNALTLMRLRASRATAKENTA